MEHLEQTAARHPIEKFENGNIVFLNALHCCLPRPVLIQLELGQLDGLSTEQTQALKRKVGITKW